MSASVNTTRGQIAAWKIRLITPSRTHRSRHHNRHHQVSRWYAVQLRTVRKLALVRSQIDRLSLSQGGRCCSTTDYIPDNDTDVHVYTDSADTLQDAPDRCCGNADDIRCRQHFHNICQPVALHLQQLPDLTKVTHPYRSQHHSFSCDYERSYTINSATTASSPSVQSVYRLTLCYWTFVYIFIHHE